jgi:HK97 family phage prohead protease
MDKAKRDRLLDAPERRGIAVSDFEVRQHGDTLELAGYASVFESPYEVYGGPPYGWTETVDRRAFDVTLREKPDVHLLINHEGMPLARTKSGTMQLSTDQTGLRVAADLDRRDPDVQKLEVKMDRGDIDEMSFAFRTKQHEWSEDESERRLIEVSIHKGDVSVVNFGANPATSAHLRSMLSFLDGLDVEAAAAEIRGIDDPVAQLTAARETIDRLLREATPPASRSMSLASARRIVDLD